MQRAYCMSNATDQKSANIRAKAPTILTGIMRGWILFQILDYANKRVASALFDKALRVQAHDSPTDRVAFIASDAESKTTLIVLPDLYDDHRMRDIARVSFSESEIKIVASAVVLDDISYIGSLSADVEALEDTGPVRGVFDGLVDEHRVR